MTWFGVLARSHFIQSNRSHRQFSAANFQPLSSATHMLRFVTNWTSARVISRWAFLAATRGCGARLAGVTFTDSWILTLQPLSAGFDLPTIRASSTRAVWVRIIQQEKVN